MNYELREWRLSDAASLAENANNIEIWNNLRDALLQPVQVETHCNASLQLCNASLQLCNASVQLCNASVQ